MSSLLDMAPRLALLDHRNLAWGNAKALSYAALNHAARNKLPNGPDILVCQLGPCSFCATPGPNEAHGDGVPLVKARGTPFQIVSAIIRFVAIEVIDLIARWNRWQKGLRNKAVDGASLRLPADAERNSNVPIIHGTLTTNSLPDNPASRMPFRCYADPFPLNRADAPEVRNLMAILKANNASPYFLHIGGSL